MIDLTLSRTLLLSSYECSVSHLFPQLPAFLERGREQPRCCIRCACCCFPTETICVMFQLDTFGIAIPSYTHIPTSPSQLRAPSPRQHACCFVHWNDAGVLSSNLRRYHARDTMFPQSVGGQMHMMQTQAAGVISDHTIVRLATNECDFFAATFSAC